MTPTESAALRVEAKRKRPKAKARKVHPVLMVVEVERRLQGRIFAFEERIRRLEIEREPIGMT
jgi:hypothetical protein